MRVLLDEVTVSLLNIYPHPWSCC